MKPSARWCTSCRTPLFDKQKMDEKTLTKYNKHAATYWTTHNSPVGIVSIKQHHNKEETTTARLPKNKTRSQQSRVFPAQWVSCCFFSFLYVVHGYGFGCFLHPHNIISALCATYILVGYTLWVGVVYRDTFYYAETWWRFANRIYRPRVAYPLSLMALGSKTKSREMP